MRPGRKLALVGVAQRLSDRLPAHWGRRARDLGKIAVNHRGQRRTAFRHVQYEVLRRASPVLAAPFGAGQVVVDARDEEIGRTVFVSGGYERWHMEAAVKELRAAGLDPTGKLFVDVGANIGTSTIDALLHFGFGRAVCFEPDADNVRLLRANLVLNQLDERATVHPLAVSDRDGFGTLQRSPSNSGDHRFSTENGAGSGRVACAPLDRFVQDGGIDPGQVGLVWIDAQGHEPQILAGATRLLEAQVPVVLEYCPWLLGASIHDLDRTIAARYSVIVDLGRAADGLPDAHLTAAGLPALGRRFARRGYADLLLLPRA